MQTPEKAIVVFYSHSNTTRKAAEKIQAALGCDIFELKPVKPYPADYNTVVKLAKKEISEGYRPELLQTPDIGEYGLVIVGSPNWWSTIAPPVASFLAGGNFSGKRIAPFVSHGGGGLGKSVAEIKKLCPGAAVAEGFDANRMEKMGAWLESLGLAR